MKSLVIAHRILTTDLTGTFVASTGVNTMGLPHHNLAITYDPDEADGRLAVEFQGTMDGPEVTDANAEWITLGTVARTAGVIAFTADDIRSNSAGAGTKNQLNVSYIDQPFQRMRIRAKETFTGGGTNQGNAKIDQISWTN